jgi:ubiquinone/menaquinone biosynthesis C-methylase UbiE
MTVYSERFTGRAAGYAQYRERYEPDVVLPLLREWCGLTPEWRIADVGAGTGMASDLFRTNGNSVIAIEPNAEMRSLCASLHASDAQFTVVDGSAEATGLPDASVDMVVVGRALHWFDIDAALREFRRIHKPGGWVAIVDCGRPEDGREENLAYKNLLQTYSAKEDFLDPLLKVYKQLDTLFAGGRFHHAEVSAEMHLDWEELRGLTLSFSHTPTPGSDVFPAFEAALRSYFDRHAQQGRVTMSKRTWINAGQFAR